MNYSRNRTYKLAEEIANDVPTYFDGTGQLKEMDTTNTKKFAGFTVKGGVAGEDCAVSFGRHVVPTGDEIFAGQKVVFSTTSAGLIIPYVNTMDADTIVGYAEESVSDGAPVSVFFY